MEERPKTLADKAAPIVAFSVLFVIMGGGILLARRNLQLGRGDKKGAFRLAVFIFVVSSISDAIRLHHVADWGEMGLIFGSVRNSLFFAGMTWLVYLALEPYVRRLWPEILISWSRLLAGRIRDPRIGSDILVGAAGGSLLSWVLTLFFVLPSWLGMDPTAPNRADLRVLMGPGQAAASLLDSLDLTFPLSFLLFLLLLRVLLRSQWAAIAALLAGGMALSLLFPGNWIVGIAFVLSLLGVFLFILVRFGLVAFMAMGLLSQDPTAMTASFSSWWAASAWIQVLVPLALLLYAFRISLAGRPLFGGDLLGEDAGSTRAIR
jgi:hypothetical protein